MNTLKSNTFSTYFAVKHNARDERIFFLECEELYLNNSRVWGSLAEDDLLSIRKAFRKVEVSNEHCKGIIFESKVMKWSTLHNNAIGVLW